MSDLFNELLSGLDGLTDDQIKQLKAGFTGKGSGLMDELSQAKKKKKSFWRRRES